MFHGVRTVLLRVNDFDPAFPGSGFSGCRSLAFTDNVYLPHMRFSYARWNSSAMNVSRDGPRRLTSSLILSSGCLLTRIVTAVRPASPSIVPEASSADLIRMPTSSAARSAFSHAVR
jgi:hypothetical protein